MGQTTGDVEARDYRTMLREELARRCQVNPRYSLRAFARDLEIAPSRLSEVLNGKQGLSRQSAERICGRLGLSDTEKQLFCDLVEAQHARSKVGKKIARERLGKRRNVYRELEHDSFQVIADWYHLAILELMGFEGFKSDPQWIGNQLNISPTEAQVGLERLSRLGLIEEKEGELVPVQGKNYVPGGVPSDSIKKFHRQLIEKAIQALFLQPIESREFFTTLIGIQPGKLEVARSLIKDFAQNFCEVMDEAGGKKDLYCIAMQFYKLSREVNHE